MSQMHILRTGRRSRWRVASSWYTNVSPEQKMFTACCACNMRADQVKVRIERMKSHMIGYYDPRHQIACRSGMGCNANPRKRRGRYLRELCHYG